MGQRCPECGQPLGTWGGHWMPSERLSFRSPGPGAQQTPRVVAAGLRSRAAGGPCSGENVGPVTAGPAGPRRSVSAGAGRASRPSPEANTGFPQPPAGVCCLLAGFLPAPTWDAFCRRQRKGEERGWGLVRVGNRGQCLRHFRSLCAACERVGLLCPGRGQLASCRRCSGPGRTGQWRR